MVGCISLVVIVLEYPKDMHKINMVSAIRKVNQVDDINFKNTHVPTVTVASQRQYNIKTACIKVSNAAKGWPLLASVSARSSPFVG